MTAEMAGKINNKLCGNYWFHSNGVVHRQQVEFLKHCSQCIPNAVLNLQNNFTIKLKVNPNRKFKIQADGTQCEQTTVQFVSSYKDLSKNAKLL